MAEVVWPGTRMFTSLSGDKEVARSHKRDARILIGYLLGTTSDLRPYAYRTVRLADGSVVQAHVWRGDGVARAKVRIWSPSFEKKEEGKLIYGLLLWVTTLENPFGFKNGAGTPITELELYPIDENDVPLARLKPYTLLTHEAAKWTVRRPTVTAAYKVGQRVWCGTNKEDVLSWDGTYVYYKYAVVFEMNDSFLPFIVTAAALYKAENTNEKSYLMLLTSRAQLRWYEWTGEKIVATDPFSVLNVFSISLSTTGCNFSASATKLGVVNTVTTPAARTYSFNPATASWADDGSVSTYVYDAVGQYIKFPVAVGWDINETLIVATVKTIRDDNGTISLTRPGIVWEGGPYVDPWEGPNYCWWWNDGNPDLGGICAAGDSTCPQVDPATGEIWGGDFYWQHSGRLEVLPAIVPASITYAELAFNDIVADTIIVARDEVPVFDGIASTYFRTYWVLSVRTNRCSVYSDGWQDVTNNPSSNIPWADAASALENTAGSKVYLPQEPAFWSRIYPESNAVMRNEAAVGELRTCKLLQLVGETSTVRAVETSVGEAFLDEEKELYWVSYTGSTEAGLRELANRVLGRIMEPDYANRTTYGVAAEYTDVVSSIVSPFWGRALVSTIPELQQKLRITGSELATSNHPTIGIGISLS